ncbi:MAG: M48 family metallopeptidase [Deltaproteobacteria bacterium]
MTAFSAIFFDGKSSTARRVRVAAEKGTLRLLAPDNDQEINYALDRCRLTPALGGSARSLLLPDGGRLESEEQRALVALEALLHRPFSQKIVENLEGRWGMALGCLVVLVFGTWLAISRGIPLLAARIAYTLPVQVNEALSDRALQIMDHGLFQTSRLTEEEKIRTRQLFAQVAKESTSPFVLRLKFRNSPKVGANAFALPSGVVIITDQLVKLAKEDRELLAVFAHECAHVENRHALRSLLQNTGALFLVSALVGDVASMTSVAGSLPTLLVETGYSRIFEHQADEAVGRIR